MADKRLHPRKRPRQRRAVATFDAIVEAAELLLRAGGLAAFNTNAVAERAGVSIGSLYQYFPDKDVLMAEIVRRDNARFLAALRDASEGSEGPVETLRRMCARAVGHQFDDPVLAATIDAEQARLPLGQEDAELRAEVVRTVAAALRELDPPPDDPTLAAADLLGVARGLLDTAALEGESDPEPVRARLERAAFGYLGLAPP